MNEQELRKKIAEQIMAWEPVDDLSDREKIIYKTVQKTFAEVAEGKYDN